MKIFVSLRGRTFLVQTLGVGQKSAAKRPEFFCINTWGKAKSAAKRPEIFDTNTWGLNDSNTWGPRFAKFEDLGDPK